MIFGVRDIVDVTIKDITTKKPKVYLASLKASSFEIGAETVWARGGRGNPKRIGWDGNKEVKMTCENCVITPATLALLSGVDLVTGVQYVPVTEVLTVTYASTPSITLTQTIYDTDLINYPLYVYKTLDGSTADTEITSGTPTNQNEYSRSGQVISLNTTNFPAGSKALVTYYTTASTSNKRVKITSDMFPKTFELTGYTLWRNEEDGKDYVCRITIPKAKLASSFTITQQPDGDPSTFKFEFEVLKSSANTDMIIYDIDEGTSVS